MGSQRICDKVKKITLLNLGSKFNVDRLKQNNIHYSLDRIKEILGTTHRVTTSIKCKDGTTLHIRQSELLNEEQKEIYNILGIKHKAGETMRIFI